MLFFVGPQDLLSAVALFSFTWNIGQQNKASCHLAAPVDLVLFFNHLGVQSKLHGDGSTWAIALGTTPLWAATMRIIAFITDAEPIVKILNHIGEPTKLPEISPARSPPAWDASEINQDSYEYHFDQSIRG